MALYQLTMDESHAVAGGLSPETQGMLHDKWKQVLRRSGAAWNVESAQRWRRDILSDEPSGGPPPNDNDFFLD